MEEESQYPAEKPAEPSDESGMEGAALDFGRGGALSSMARAGYQEVWSQYSPEEVIRRIDELNIEEAQPQYTKLGLVAELKRRGHIVSRSDLSARLTYSIKEGLIDPPIRQPGKRGRPGLYPGSVVIIEDLLRLLIVKGILFFRRSDLAEELRKLKVRAARIHGLTEAPSPMPISMDKVYAELIRQEASSILRKIELRSMLGTTLKHASHALRALTRNLRELQDIDKDLAKEFLTEHQQEISELYEMIGTTKSKE